VSLFSNQDDRVVPVFLFLRIWQTAPTKPPFRGPNSILESGRSFMGRFWPSGGGGAVMIC